MVSPYTDPVLGPMERQEGGTGAGCYWGMMASQIQIEFGTTWLEAVAQRQRAKPNQVASIVGHPAVSGGRRTVWDQTLVQGESHSQVRNQGAGEADI
jgi:hypothetical protein